MNTWTRIIGGLVVLYAAYVIYRGQIRLTSDDTHTSRLVKRSEKPVQFWLSVGLMLVVAVILIFNVFHF